MSQRPSDSTLRDEFESLVRMSRQGPRHEGVAGLVRDSQYMALCFGAMLAIAWMLGEGPPPIISIDQKVKEINEQ